jgi:predicted O-linked N-acetylglucosamine transferase (SPINDLY family)
VFELFETALACHAQGKLAEAEQFYENVIEADNRHFGSIHGLGLIRLQQGRFADAVPLFRRAAKIDRSSAEASHHLGVALTGLGRPQEAVERFEHALTIRPHFAEAHDSLGHALQMLDRCAEALAHHERAIALRPRYAEAHNNLGNALHRLGRSDQATAQYTKALAILPDYPEAHNNLGRALASLGRHEEALPHFQAALRIRPDYGDARLNLGSALWILGRHQQALDEYNVALTSRPDHVETLCARGLALSALKRFDVALGDFEKALSLDSCNPHAWNGVATSAILACDWTRVAKLSGDLARRVARRELVINPFTYLGCCDDPALQLECARTFAAHQITEVPQPLWKGAVWRNRKIRIAYIAAGFHHHPNAYLTAELFELHDRSRFEIFGISLGPDDNSNIRARIVASFDEFHDVRSRDDRDVAGLLHARQIDIAVDRSGYVADARQGIFAHRPAPIQVNYLGYPGTLGADFYDYIIADPIALPIDQQPFFTEKVVHLPECYQVNDSKRAVVPRVPSRAEAGLPDTGFVFCCFNNNYKVNAEVFGIWMRLLQRVEGSVLWLLRDNAAAQANLQKEAAARGIDPKRLVFAERVESDVHLARHRLADLFLDTLPYNAHTTGSDALWIGVPVVTCRGGSFQGRVASSLLAAVGMPELVSHSLEQYEHLALRLATEPAELHAMREKLRRNRTSCPLFHTDRYRRHIEAAYTTMWEIWQRGEAPRSFAVEPFEPAAVPFPQRPVLPKPAIPTANPSYS